MDGPLVCMAVADAAHIVLAVFQNRREYLGKKLGICSERKTIAEYAAIISRVTGKTYRYVQVPFEQFRNQPNDPTAELFAAELEYISYGNPSYSEEFTRKIFPGALNFEEWVEQNKDSF